MGIMSLFGFVRTRDTLITIFFMNMAASMEVDSLQSRWFWHQRQFTVTMILTPEAASIEVSHDYLYIYIYSYIYNIYVYIYSYGKREKATLWIDSGTFGPLPGAPLSFSGAHSHILQADVLYISGHVKTLLLSCLVVGSQLEINMTSL